MLILGIVPVQRVRPQGGRLVPAGTWEDLTELRNPHSHLEERIAQGEEPPYVQFASLNEEDPEALADFVSREGWLGTDEIDAIAHEIRKMRAVLQVVEALRTEPADAQQLLEACRMLEAVWGEKGHPVEEDIESLQAHARYLLSKALTRQLEHVQVEVAIVDFGERLELALHIDDLLASMYLELARDILETDDVPRKCQNRTCRNWFLTHRSDRRYCSPRCASADRMRRWRNAHRNQEGEGTS
ncbi:CGNR zinc finger domain-containing protein [Thermaerobacter subterraneus]|uniref:Zinc finger CGNR domain-containing protein n=1 Tax=Thermaerobacter subterraneus DSM 13965 TaxID=867903 RepID=K6Q0S7_9FIRM|nr:CGNR zinc finger domain-containing protein [Thermaerobacter subterraneus]EKP94489.1 hypothetical protein ThesuDRAFT_02226 [Thermaerobacter subterraneus DSM 13965]